MNTNNEKKKKKMSAKKLNYIAAIAMLLLIGVPSIYPLITSTTGYYNSIVDPDGDGLTTKKETAKGTNPETPDSDYDNINDKDDTNPLSSDLDSDLDGVTDGAEALAGTDPNDVTSK